MPPYRDPDERFWEKVDKSGDCWLWTASCNVYGYGQFCIGRGQGTILAHIYAYRTTVGPIPPGHELDHRYTCLKTCVRPPHLRPVTRKQNQENRPGPIRGNVSGYRGVSWIKADRRWRASLKHHGKSIYLGQYATPEEANEVVVAKRLELFTHNDADRN